MDLGHSDLRKFGSGSEVTLPVWITKNSGAASFADLHPK